MSTKDQVWFTSHENETLSAEVFFWHNQLNLKAQEKKSFISDMKILRLLCNGKQNMSGELHGFEFQ